mmetsp:Transcript_36948/g.96705  ORF Transcript_36948/g.96705 Transcript_36948/m.96705 type:complete len:233 (+) Transcript_36948:709-1407(+)
MSGRWVRLAPPVGVETSKTGGIGNRWGSWSLSVSSVRLSPWYSRRDNVELYRAASMPRVISSSALLLRCAQVFIMSRFSALRMSEEMSLCRRAIHLCSMLMFRSSAAALAATAAENARLDAGGVKGAGTVWCKLGGDVSRLAAAEVGLDPKADDGRDPWAVGARDDSADRAVSPPTVVDGVRGRSLESSSMPSSACFSFRSLNLAESLWLGIARTRANGVLGLLFAVFWGCA